MPIQSGKLGAVDLASTAEQTLYTCGAGGTGAVAATATVSFCNRTSGTVTVRLAVGTGGGAATTDYLEYDAQIPASGVLERTGIVLSAGEKIFVKSSAAGVTVRAYGFEK